MLAHINKSYLQLPFLLQWDFILYSAQSPSTMMQQKWILGLKVVKINEWGPETFLTMKKFGNSQRDPCKLFHPQTRVSSAV